MWGHDDVNSDVKNVANKDVKNMDKKICQECGQQWGQECGKKLGQEWGHNNVVDNKAKKGVMIEIKKIR